MKNLLIMGISEQSAIEIYQAVRGKISMEAEVELQDVLEKAGVDLDASLPMRPSEIDMQDRVQN